MVGRLAILLAAGAAAVPAPAPPVESLAVQVNRAIERGVARLRSQQKEDGTFESGHREHYPDGVTALMLYALLKSGVPPEDPAAVKALAAFRYLKVEKVYCAGARILALDALKDPSQDDAIQALAEWIEDTVDRKDRIWAYPKGPGAEYRRTDLSNTQFAVLGLRVAENHGYRPREETWAGLLEKMPALVGLEGGFFYSDNRGGKEVTGSMTAAGILCMEIALERIDRRKAEGAALHRKSKAILARAWEYLDGRFTPEGNPVGAHALKTEMAYYYLYGVERAAAFTGRKEIGGRDWYAEGARVLVREQRADGSWGSNEDTAFALLFLRRATFTLATGRQPPAPEGEGIAAAPPPPKGPAFGTPFVRRWLLLGPIPNPGDDLLESAVPHEEEPEARGPWRVHRSLPDWVDLAPLSRVPPPYLYGAFTWLHAAQDSDVVLWLGFDDGTRVFLDGRLVLDRHRHELVGIDGWSLPLHLSKGAHRLLLKVEENGGGTGFALRIAHPDGTWAAEVLPSLSGRDAELPETALAQPAYFTPEELLRVLAPEPSPRIGFDSASDAERLAYTSFTNAWWPWWFAEDPGPGPRRPYPGFRGAIGLHPLGTGLPARAYLRVRVPQGKSRLSVRVSGGFRDPKRDGVDDGRMRLLVFDGRFHTLWDGIVGEKGAPGPERWRTIETPTTEFAGKEVLVVVENAAGGVEEWAGEDLWIDEIALR